MVSHDLQLGPGWYHMTLDWALDGARGKFKGSTGKFKNHEILRINNTQRDLQACVFIKRDTTQTQITSKISNQMFTS